MPQCAALSVQRGIEPALERRRTMINPIPILALALLGAAVAPQNAFPDRPPWTKAADNKIHAQAVIDRLMANEPDLVAIGLHSVPPGVAARPNEPGQVVIAQVDDIIGRPDTSQDLDIGRLEQIRIFRAPLGGVMRMRFYSPLYDRAGRNIGLVVLAFRLSAKTTALSTHIKAARILRTLSDQFSDQAALFEKAP